MGSGADENCGYCTPGIIMTAKALLDENPVATEEDISEYLHGNIRRCTGYVKIVEAVEAARDVLAKRKG
jgi:carbon-monoxide dehydrogenase small subunit